MLRPVFRPIDTKGDHHEKKFATLLALLLLPACAPQAASVPASGFGVILINDCQAGTDPWTVHIRDMATDQMIYAQTLNPGESVIDTTFSAGTTYVIYNLRGGSAMEDSIYLDAPSKKMTYYARALCGALEVPVTYYLANNCAGIDPTDSHFDTIWHWRLEMVAPSTPDGELIAPVDLSIPLGESVSGELPGGIYTVNTWYERDPSQSMLYTAPSSSIGNIYVNFCPENDPLPGAPANPNH